MVREKIEEVANDIKISFIDPKFNDDITGIVSVTLDTPNGEVRID